MFQRTLLLKSTIHQLSFTTKIQHIMKYIYIPFIFLGIALFTLNFSHKSDSKPTIKPIKESQIIRVVGYGNRLHPIMKVEKLHSGTDYIAKYGTPVLSTADGKVTKIIHQNKGYGNQITVTHSRHLKTTYSHLSDIDIELGEKVSQYQMIAKVGNSGASTGPHLHYEIEKDNKKVDPATYINQ